MYASKYMKFLDSVQSPEEIVTKSYVILMDYRNKNKESENQSVEAKSKLKAFESILTRVNQGQSDI